MTAEEKNEHDLIASLEAEGLLRPGTADLLRSARRIANVAGRKRTLLVFLMAIVIIAAILLAFGFSLNGTGITRALCWAFEIPMFALFVIVMNELDDV